MIDVRRAVLGAAMLLGAASVYAQTTPKSASSPAPAASKPDCSGIYLPPPTMRPPSAPMLSDAQVAEQRKQQSDALCAKYRAACGKEHPACVKS